jgi:hypothetical protein
VVDVVALWRSARSLLYEPAGYSRFSSPTKLVRALIAGRMGLMACV